MPRSAAARVVIRDLVLTGGDSSELPNVPAPPLGGQNVGGSGGALRTGMDTTLTNVYVTANRGGYSGGGVSAPRR